MRTGAQAPHRKCESSEVDLAITGEQYYPIHVNQEASPRAKSKRGSVSKDKLAETGEELEVAGAVEPTGAAPCKLKGGRWQGNLPVKPSYRHSCESRNPSGKPALTNIQMDSSFRRNDE
mgnify:CR=1 FL=1